MAEICSNCGAQVPEGSAFCQNCGGAMPKNGQPQTNQMPSQQAPQPQSPPQAQDTFSQPMPQPAAQLTSKKKKGISGKKIALSIVSVFVVIAIVAASVILIPRLGANEEDEDDSAIPAISAEDMKRTVMIYCVGSNLESEYGAASADIEEMLAADINTEKNKVLIYTGGSRSWVNPAVSSSENAVFLVGEDDIQEVKAFSLASMGTSSSLTSFINYSTQNYPADRYSLILWDHGSGPLEGYGNDELFSNDNLTMSELDAALGASAFFDENKLEMIGFDACLMGSIETAWFLRDYAEYFVASQELEPGEGWDYTFLEKLNDCANGAELGRLIVDSYIAFYEDLFDKKPYQKADVTLSCTDLSKVDAVEQAMDALFGVVNKDVVSGNITNASRCRNRAKGFGRVRDGDFNGFDLIDILHMTTLLKNEYADSATQLEKALGEYIVYSRSNTLNANGVSVYHPYDNILYANYWLPAYKAFGFSKSYSEYLYSFYNHVTTYASSATDYREFSKTSGSAVENNGKSDLSIKLTQEQAENFSSAQYVVYRKVSADQSFSGEDEYVRVFSGYDTSLSADGTLSATYASKAVFATKPSTGEKTDYPLAMEQVYDGQGDPKYYFICGFGRDYFTENFEYKVLKWLMKTEEGKPVLAGAYESATEDDITPDKHIYNADDYEVYDFMNSAVLLKPDSNGKMTLYATDSFYGYQFTKESGIELEYREIENKKDYIAVFVVTDIYGNKHISDVIPLAD